MAWSKEERRKYMNDRYREQMDSFIQFLGGRCAKCGEVQGLNIDHVDPSAKSFDVGKLWGKGKLHLVFGELKKCQLLCDQCNRKKTDADLAGIARRKVVEKNGPDGFVHGTFYAWMQKKCPCEVCYSAKREWHRDRNAKRRKKSGGRGPYAERF